MKDRDTSAAEAPSTAMRQEPVEAPGDQPERFHRRARLVESIGRLDSSVYPDGYLENIRTAWHDRSTATRNAASHRRPAPVALS